MNFKTTLTPQNRKEFVKSWTSVYQTGLMQLRNEKRTATDVGFIRPVTSYLAALVLGYLILNWGLQLLVSGFSGLEICFGALVLFIIALNISYAIRPGWFGHIADKRILPKGPVEIQASEDGVSFCPEGGRRVTWKWSEITRLVSFPNTVVLYTGEQKSFPSCKGHVLLINKNDLAGDELHNLYSLYLDPLHIKNRFQGYYSYSDIAIFLLLCLAVALAALPSLLF